MRRSSPAAAAVVLALSVSAAIRAQPDDGPRPLDLTEFEPAVRAQFEAAFASLEVAAAPGSPATGLAAAHGEVGQLHDAYRMPDLAETHYRRAVELAPDDARWIYLLGVLLQAEGQVDESEGLLERVLALDPGAHPARVRLGAIREGRGELGEAKLLFRDAVEEHSGCAPGRVGLARVALAEGKFAAAARLLETVLDEAPEATQLHYPLGLAYRGLGRLDLARVHLSKAGDGAVPTFDPLARQVDELARSAIHVRRRGTRLIKAGRLDEAIQFLEDGARTYPEEVSIRVDLGAALMGQGQVDAARDQFGEALRLDPDNAAALTSMAGLLAREGRREEAIALLRRALEVEETRVFAHLEMARLLSLDGDLAGAAEHFSQVRRLDPTTARAWVGESRLLLALGRYREAAMLLEDARRLFPDLSEPLVLLARLLAACPDPAMRDGARALELVGEDPGARTSPLLLEIAALALAGQERCDEAWARAADALAAGRFEGRVKLVERLERLTAVLAAGPPCSPGFSSPTELFPNLFDDLPAFADEAAPSHERVPARAGE